MRQATNRLFFALRPDPACAARIHAFALDLSKSHGLVGRPLAVERLHTTLCFLGEHAELPPVLLAAADQAASGLQHAPFELAFDRVMSFSRQGEVPVVLCQREQCAPLARLRAALCAALAGTGRFQLENREFKPHVTLLYDRRPLPPEDIAPIGWFVTELVLVRSLIGQGRHEVLSRYALG
jgi:2'-5' RNA ligase